MTKSEKQWVASAADFELVKKREQIEVSMSCGPGSTAMQSLREQLSAINGELALRAKNVDAAKQRIKSERPIADNVVRKLVRQYYAEKLFHIGHGGDDEYEEIVKMIGEVLAADERIKTLIRDERNRIARVLYTEE